MRDTGPARGIPVRSWLYAPGNNPKLLERVFDAGADAVVLDLEDAVPAAEKSRARDLVAEAVQSRPGRDNGRPLLTVRVNHVASGLTEADVRAVVQPGLAGLRLPKVETAVEVHRVDAWLGDAEVAAGLAIGSIHLLCSIESAIGVRNAEEIASSSPRVLALGFGSADYSRDVGAHIGPDGLEALYARSALVIASRVAEIVSPVDGVYTCLDDDDGLERSTRRSRALGFFGRSCIHPRQVAIVNAVFTPQPDEIAHARVVMAAYAAAERDSRGAARLPNGEFVDQAVARRAKALIELAALVGAAGSA